MCTLINYSTDDLEKKHHEICAKWIDHRFLAKIQDICFPAKHVCYHSICRVKYENTTKSTPLAKDLSLQKTTMIRGITVHQTRNARKKAFVEVAELVYYGRIYKQESSFI